MKQLMLMLFLSISLFSCNGKLSDFTACIPQTKFNAAYCGTYSPTKLEFITKLEKHPITVTNDAFCVPKEEWLTKLRPEIKNIYRVKKDEGKALIIDGQQRLRDIYRID